MQSKKIDHLKNGMVLFEEALSRLGIGPVFAHPEDKQLITGYNTDIEWQGKVYHVQTEDKGIDSPMILTLVYCGGAILASKRVLYDDLLEKGFIEADLIDRLSRQHTLICAAIKSGRLDDLKEMSRRDAEARAAMLAPPAPAPAEAQSRVEPERPARVIEAEVDIVLDADQYIMPPPTTYVPEPVESVDPPKPVITTPDPGFADVSERVNLFETISDNDVPALEFLHEQSFSAGQNVEIKLKLVSSVSTGRTPVPNASIGMKILGTTFRPVILSAKTDKLGIATFSVVLPYFTSGRAAILVRAAMGAETVELRRIIHHG